MLVSVSVTTSQDDPAIVKAAVAGNSVHALEHASERLRGDPELRRLAPDYDPDQVKAEMMAKVAEDGRALQCASERLRDDMDVVKVALAQNGCALAPAHTFRSTEVHPPRGPPEAGRGSDETLSKMLNGAGSAVRSARPTCPP